MFGGFGRIFEEGRRSEGDWTQDEHRWITGGSSGNVRSRPKLAFLCRVWCLTAEDPY